MASPHASPTLGAKHIALLGLVAEEPIHAYGLEDKIRKRHMTEWTEIGFSSIYRVLSQLEDGGQIQSRLEHEGQGATRKIYSVNPSGREALTKGVLDLLGSFRPVRNPFQVGIAFIAHAPHDEAVARLRARLLEVEGWLEQLSALSIDPAAASCGTPAVGRQLVLDHAWRHVRVEREFLLHALAVLTRSDGDAPDPQEVT